MTLTIVVPALRCACRHPLDCDHLCHARHDRDAAVLDTDWLPDDGGLTRSGCDVCTPGVGTDHLMGCPAVPGSETPTGTSEYI